MPIYEYRCEKGHTFEVMQRMTDEPVETCRTCERPVQRVFHPVAVHFKGSGFYNTDYGKQRRGRGGEGEGEAATPEGDGAKPSEKGAGESKGSGPESKGTGKDGSSASTSSSAGAKAGSSRSSSD